MNKGEIINLHIDTSNKRVLLKEYYKLPMNKKEKQKLYRTKQILSQREQNNSKKEEKLQILQSLF